MTTRAVAQAALIAVATAGFYAQVGGLYTHAAQSTVFVNAYPLNAFDGPKVAVYADGGEGLKKGLGYTRQYSDSRFRVEVFGRNYDEAEAMSEWINDAWVDDMDTEPSVNTALQGYLRLTGGIKWLDLSEFAALEYERASNAYYRRRAILLVRY